MRPPDELATDAIAHGFASHTSAAWSAAVPVLLDSLDCERRMALAIAAMAACDPDDLDEIVTAISSGAGSPVPPFEAVMSEAMFWADLASRDELKAYAVATFLRMQPRDQSAFLTWTQRRAAA